MNRVVSSLAMMLPVRDRPGGGAGFHRHLRGIEPEPWRLYGHAFDKWRRQRDCQLPLRHVSGRPQCLNGSRCYHEHMASDRPYLRHARLPDVSDVRADHKLGQRRRRQCGGRHQHRHGLGVFHPSEGRGGPECRAGQIYRDNHHVRFRLQRSNRNVHRHRDDVPHLYDLGEFLRLRHLGATPTGHHHHRNGHLHQHHYLECWLGCWTGIGCDHDHAADDRPRPGRAGLWFVPGHRGNTKLGRHALHLHRERRRRRRRAANHRGSTDAGRIEKPANFLYRYRHCDSSILAKRPYVAQSDPWRLVTAKSEPSGLSSYRACPDGLPLATDRQTVLLNRQLVLCARRTGIMPVIRIEFASSCGTD
jgi:hypothetical protein